MQSLVLAAMQGYRGVVGYWVMVGWWCVRLRTKKTRLGCWGGFVSRGSVKNKSKKLGGLLGLGGWVGLGLGTPNAKIFWLEV